MTLKDVILKVQKTYVNAEPEVICQALNELEHRIKSEIFLPAGITPTDRILKYQRDKDELLLLDENHIYLYLFFIYSRLSLMEGDTDTSSVMAANFNQQFKELETEYRRAYLPNKNYRIIGGNLL